MHAQYAQKINELHDDRQYIFVNFIYKDKGFPFFLTKRTLMDKYAQGGDLQGERERKRQNENIDKKVHRNLMTEIKFLSKHQRRHI